MPMVESDASSTEDLVIHSAGDDWCVATWRNVLMTNWRGVVVKDPLAATRAISFGLAERYPEGVAVYNVVERGIPMPDPELRRLASDIIHDTGDHLRCTSTVIIGEGIWAGMARAALAGITLFARHRHPQKVFGTLEDSAEWVAPMVSPPGTPVALLVKQGEQMRQTTSA